MKTSTLALLIAITLFLPLCANATIKYEVIDLGTLGGAESWAYCINDSGQIVGWAENISGYRRATLFDPTGNGNNIDLGTLGGRSSQARSINDNGQVVGDSGGGATLFDPTGNAQNMYLGALKSDYPTYYGKARSINNKGQIVGNANTTYRIPLWPVPQSVSHATLFDPTGNGDNIDLGSQGKYESIASSINNIGQIVGWEIRNARHAILFDPTGNGNNIDLGTIGGPRSEAWSINDFGQIVGSSQISGYYTFHATLFDSSGNGNNIDLDSLSGIHGQSWAYSINNNGQIVGKAHKGSGKFIATLFDPTGAGDNINLNTLIDPDCGWYLTSANSINNHGWIVGNGINPDGYERAFLLVPEPATIALLGLGILCLRKRRK